MSDDQSARGQSAPTGADWNPNGEFAQAWITGVTTHQGAPLLLIHSTSVPRETKPGRATFPSGRVLARVSPLIWVMRGGHMLRAPVWLPRNQSGEVQWEHLDLGALYGAARRTLSD